MLVNIHHDSAKEHNRLLVAGLGFLLSLALLVWLSIAIYNKEFDRVTMVTVKADRAGLQLAKFGDVRINGALVGQVRKVTQDGEEAEIHIALDPDAAKEIPANITVEILPTTLFGQKYISFNRPAEPSPDSIEDGDVIPADRVDTNVELSQILADLFPLLRAVRPADLNATLNALSTALEGRGEQIGADDGRARRLPRRHRRPPPDAAAGPDRPRRRRRHLRPRRARPARHPGQRHGDQPDHHREGQDLDVFFADLAGLAKTSTRILRANEQNMIEVGRVTEPVLALLHTYSPELPCLLKGAAATRRSSRRPSRATSSSSTWSSATRSSATSTSPTDGVRRGRTRPVVPRPAELQGPGGRVPLDNGSDIDENPPSSIIPTSGRCPTST